MDVIIFHARKIEFIQESKGVLHVNVVVGYAMHQQEPDIALESGHVADGGVFVAIRIVVRGLHVSFCVDGVLRPSQSCSDHGRYTKAYHRISNPSPAQQPCRI